MDYKSFNFSNFSNNPNLNRVNNELNKFKIKQDGKSIVSNEISDIQASNLNSSVNKENIRIESKKIVNNKPSQFGPVLGVNFHNVKR